MSNDNLKEENLKEEKNEQEEKDDKESLEKKLENCEKLKEEYLSSLKRVYAEFINYKTEEEKRLNETKKMTKKMMLLKLLPLIDNFEIIEQNLDESVKEQGIKQFKQQIEDFLKKESVLRIKTVGEFFDPSLHEAVEVVDGQDKGKIIEEIQAGYLFEDQVLRPAKVKVVKF